MGQERQEQQQSVKMGAGEVRWDCLRAEPGFLFLAARGGWGEGGGVLNYPVDSQFKTKSKYHTHM